MTAPYLAEMQTAIATQRAIARMIEDMRWWDWIFPKRSFRRQLVRWHRDIAADISRWSVKARAAEVALDRLADDAHEEALLAERDARWRNKRAKVLLFPAHRERGPEPLDPRPAA